MSQNRGGGGQAFYFSWGWGGGETLRYEHCPNTGLVFEIPGEGQRGQRVRGGGGQKPPSPPSSPIFDKGLFST